MGKSFHILSLVNDLKTGKVGKRITTNTNKENKMAIKQNEEFQRTHVPPMPKLNFRRDNEQDPIEMVLNHLTAKHGSESAAKSELKKLDGAAVLTLLESLKDNKQETGIIKGKDGQEFYTAPVMKF